MSKRALLALAAVFASLACHAEPASPPPTVAAAHDPFLQHHEIRPEQLPAPYATPSSGNPPFVSSRPPGAALHVPPGFAVSLWADKLDDPRNMILAPNGDVFVAETGAGRILVLRDDNHDGKPDRSFTFATGLNGPFGLAFRGDWLYVGNEDSIVRFPYRAGQTAGTGPVRLASLPTGGHSTRNLIFSRDGSTLYAAIGSSSNVSREEPPRAAIMAYDAEGRNPRVYASGLRNPVGLAWSPTGSLWTAVNERDGLGDDLVPDYATQVQSGAFYGWPYAYIGAHEEPRRKGERPDLVAKAVVPSVLIQSHSAALGIVFYPGGMFPPQYTGSAFVALHGSWNRSRRTGYKVINVPFRNGRPVGGYDDFVAGWEPSDAERAVWGRPVGLLVLRDGSLLVSDDGANVIWRVTYK
jgi:glucose/arabinose dehydrogenase